jgi:quinol monooxygenase YgiN
MVNVIATVQVKEGKTQEFIKLFKTIVPLVKAEKGCIEYYPTVDLPTGLPPQDINENVVTIIEKWESLDHLMAHLSTRHMAEHMEKEKDFVEEASIKILQEA